MRMGKQPTSRNEKGVGGGSQMLKRHVKTIGMAGFRQSLDLGMHLLLSSFDTRLRASTADGVVLVVCRRLHMSRMEVAKFTVQRALFALSDASKLQTSSAGKSFDGQLPIGFSKTDGERSPLQI